MRGNDLIYLFICSSLEKMLQQEPWENMPMMSEQQLTIIWNKAFFHFMWSPGTSRDSLLRDVIPS